MQSTIHNLREAILATLSYFDIFNYPLTQDEVHHFLWWPGASPQRLFAVVQELEHMYKAGMIDMRSGFFFLKGREENVRSRSQRFVRSIAQWRRAQKLFSTLTQVPFLRASALCNQFSLNNAKETSDIDVFIIAEKERIWSVRFLVTFFTWVQRKWRHGTRVAGRFCLSFYLTNDSLDLRFMRKQPYDVYLVYWIATLAFVQGSSREFFAANGWVKEFLPNFEPRREIPLHTARAPLFEASARLEEKIWSGWFGRMREKVLRMLQISKMKQTKKAHGLTQDVEVSDTILKFHENDRRELFRNEFEKKFAEQTRAVAQMKPLSYTESK